MSEHDHHVSSAKLLLATGFALLFLTILTVAVTYINIPEPFNLVVAIGIAVVKATVVALFFMNLYWDVAFNSMLLVTSVIFVLLLVGLTMLDTMFRHDLIPTF